MSPKTVLVVLLSCEYVILTSWALDIQTKVDSTSVGNNGVVDKRDLKSDAKFFDPPPEYYRGPPGSSSGSSFGSERDRIRDRDSYGIGLQRPPYGVSGGVGFDSRYPSPPRVTPTPAISGSRYGGFQDRIGYGPSGPYGSAQPPYGSAQPPYGGSSFGNPSSSSRTPYGPPTPIDFPSYHRPPAETYYPPTYATDPWTSFWSKKGFSGVGNYFPTAGPNDFYYPDKSQYKSLLVPLIGGAILGITAALVANPALLHLGTLSGKRRRRDTSAELEDSKKLNDHAQTLAYRAYREKKLI